MKPDPPRPTADTWVYRNKDGEYKTVKVALMESAHLQRWLAYFRRKLRDSGHPGNDAELDVTLCATIVTAPAIIAEAKKRGVYYAGQVPQVKVTVDIPSMACPACGQPMGRLDPTRYELRCANGHHVSMRQLQAAERSKAPRLDMTIHESLPASIGVRHISLDEDEDD